MKSKLLKNALIGESLRRFTRQEKHDIVTELLKRENISQRELAKQINVPYATVHDWKSLRQDNTSENIHVSFHHMIRKLKSINPTLFKDWGRLEELKEICENLLNNK